MTEQDHHGFPSYRVRGKIFATAPDAEHWHVMATESEIRAAAETDAGCEEKWWGKRLSAVRVTLRDIDAARFAELLDDAYRRSGG